jgi:NAD(P)-dependent dehydrogenase (short-subunit alcohol dehydrogenase family)
MNDGVRVNTIMPGIFDTPLMQRAPAGVRQALAEGVPFPKRLGAAEEYASVVLEICRNPYFNGAALRLDGALRMGPR